MDNSRTSRAAAGWEYSGRAFVDEREPAHRGIKRFSWKALGTLLRARNERLAPKLFADPVPAQRNAWVAQMQALGEDDFVVARPELTSFSFLLVGDTGEGDYSQLATIPLLLEHGDGTAFMVIASDVIYPAGNVNEYPAKFYAMYGDYGAPVYAVPGNHDWDDGGLFGFMYHFCRAAGEPPRANVPWWARLGLLGFRVYKRPRGARQAATAERAHHAPNPDQPGPYWAIDTPHLRIVGIDTGMHSTIDVEQGAWLREVSTGEKPKILVTGKPLYVDGRRAPCAIVDANGHEHGTVAAIVGAREHNYVAAIGGDVHNYQRYPVEAEPGRTIPYLVSGGGGAFMGGTHTLPKVPPEVANEDDVRFFPRRGDSLAAFSYLYVQRSLTFIGRMLELLGLVALGWAIWVEGWPPRLLAWLGVVAFAVGAVVDACARPIARRLFIPPEVAATIIQKRTGIAPSRQPPSDARTKPRSWEWLLAAVVFVGARGGVYSPFWDWDTLPPPFFKSFLRIDVAEGTVRIRCYGVSGAGEVDSNRDPEDEMEWTASGGWTFASNE